MKKRIKLSIGGSLRKTACFCLCLTAVSVLAAPIVIDKTDKFSTALNGLVLLPGVDRGVVRAGAELKIDSPVKIRMKMRRLALTEVAPDRHFGVGLEGGDDFKASFYTRGSGFIAALSQGKSDIGGTGNRDAKVLFPVSLDSQWVNVELYVQPKLTEIHVAGKPQGLVNACLLPLKAINLYAYHTDIEIKDLETELLPEVEPISTDPNPSFEATFDHGLSGMTTTGTIDPTRATKITLVPGLSGQAARVSAMDAPETPINVHPSWKPVNGALESRGPSKGEFSLAVPELTHAVIRLNVKRLMVPEGEQHFGIGLGGADWSISFYTRGPEILYRLDTDKKTLAHKSLGPIHLQKGGKDSPRYQFEFTLRDGNIDVVLDGKPIGSVSHPFPPLAKVSYYNYKLDTAIDDFEVISDVFNFSEDFTTFVNPLDPPVLEYDADQLFANHGTVMFWMKSDWDGRFTGDIPVYPMLSGLDAEGKQRLGISMYHWISASLGRTDGLTSVEMKRNVRGSWYRGDWNHVAMVWSDGGWCKAYCNGLPYQQPFGFNGKIFTNLDLDSIVRFTLGSGTHRAAESAFDELKIYKRPLSNGEIYDAYRAFMPIDLLLDRTVLDVGKSEEVVLLAAPGGFYMRPMPAERPLMTGQVDIKMTLVDETDNVVAEKTFSPNLIAPTALRLPVSNLSEGKYRLKCTVGPALQRSFELLAYQPKPAVPANNDEIELGEIIFEKDLKDGYLLDAGGINEIKTSIGTYFEAGKRKEHRFSFEVRFPGKHLDGRPVMVEVEWPDDKPRSMGLYLYPESKSAHHRDRLGGGIQSGVEYPLSGNMQTTRYLFFPGRTNYLFEARTMIGDYPAAIAAFRVYEIKNKRLPRLAINAPKGMPARQFGYLDEDETPDQNLGWDYPDRTPQSVTERLLDYLNYTGQNTWQYPFMRYTGYNIAMEGALHNLYPYRADAYRYMVEAMHRRGVDTIANINLFTLPEMKMLPDLNDASISNGWPLTKYSDPPVQPNKYTRSNHANPNIRNMICRHVREVAERFGPVPGVKGINFSTDMIGFYPSLDYGYDDYTVALFAKETGVVVEATTGEERYAFLTQEPQLSTWQKWRDAHTLTLFRQMRAEIDKVNPALNLYLAVSMVAGSAGHEANSVSPTTMFDELRAIKGVYLVPTSNATAHRWLMHFGRPADGCNDLIFNPKHIASFMNDGLGFVDGYHSYFESFNGSLKNDVYASYFQNADVKPFGRYFLKELAFAVSGMDAQRILIGGQPLGTWGRDIESREFAKAYCALPALPFENAPGAQDPVAVRYLSTEAGSYLYAVSMLWNDCETTLTLSSKSPITDLSTGETITDGRITLKSFELRSFFSIDPELKVTAVTTVVPDNVLQFYRKQVDLIEAAVLRLNAAGIDCKEAASERVNMQQLLQDGQFAELHRLVFSLSIREVLGKADNFDNVAKQAEMMRRGQYAVNCGSTTFYTAHDGTLFFPDRALAKGNYGYVGSYLSVTRNTDGLQSPDPELFITESYSLNTYRFKVPAGKYKVRLYMKAGYQKGFKPDVFVFSVDIQGKRVLENLDLVTHCDSDFTKVAVEEFDDIHVENGILEIRLSNEDKYDPSAKMLNAIEIIPCL